MAFAGINYIAVFLAGIASFIFGAVWYMTLSKLWMHATGLTADEIRGEHGRLDRSPFLISLSGELFLALMLAGLIGHIGPVTIVNSLASAFFVWSSFTLVPLAINHRYQLLPWSLTFIDAGHWLGVMMLQGLIIGAFGV
ncbi:DUF1761 domain-containing protein [Afifella pfennigii]|uniref:DUF1761 domain-containing protein n=1 Tax=Afifella pfennigii TaxID=209897 RepID=UPI00047BCEDE|nr:DUF1761 domain-containing protein [Afifella pfennigii]